MTAQWFHLALIAAILFLAALWLLWPLRRRLLLRVGLGLVIVALCVMVPLPAPSLFAFVAGALWPLSFGTVVGVAHDLASCIAGRSLLGTRDRMVASVLTILIGLPLYASALGFVSFDIYALGYSGPAVPVVMAAIVVIGVLARSYLTLFWISATALGGLLGLHASLNMWDYLIDPLVLFSGVIWLASIYVGRIYARWRKAATTAS